jgi:hypothetical protein
VALPREACISKKSIRWWKVWGYSCKWSSRIANPHEDRIVIHAPAALLLTIMMLASASFLFRKSLVLRSGLTAALVVVLLAGAWGLLG